jgi:hypothetical protein
MGLGGPAQKMGGGGEKGLDWCMTKAGVRYNRIPDPAHVLSARGWARGKERKQIITGGEALLKMSNRVILFFSCRHGGTQCKKIK